MRAPLVLSLLLCLSSVTACTSTPSAAPAPLVVLRPVELSLKVEPTVGEFTPAAADFAGAGDSQLRFEVSLYSVAPAAIAETVPLRGVSPVGAAACALGDAQRWLHALEARGDVGFSTVGDAHTLALGDGQRGHVRVVNQSAFVRGFELQQNADSAVADPQIGVVHEGLQLQVVAQRSAGGETCEVDVELVLASVDRPLSERRVRVTTVGAPVVVHRPEGWTWTLRVHEALAGDEVLVLTCCPDSTKGTALVALLRALPTEIGESEPLRAR